MASTRLEPIDNSKILDLNTFEGKCLASLAIGVLVFGILAGLVAALVVTGNMAKFLEFKANLSIGQGLLYIGVPCLVAAIFSILVVKRF